MVTGREVMTRAGKPYEGNKQMVWYRMCRGDMLLDSGFVSGGECNNVTKNKAKCNLLAFGRP